MTENRCSVYHKTFIISTRFPHRKRRPDSAQTALMPLKSHTSSQFSLQHRSSARQSMQSVIYYHCPVHLYHPPFDLIFSMRLYGTVNDLTKIECMLVVIYPHYTKAERQNLISACCLENNIISFQIYRNSLLSE